MNLPYLLRLVLLSAASFFVVYCAASLAVYAAVPGLVRRAGTREARREAGLLAGLRLLPLALALFAVVALCVPGYLRFEPEADAERAGLFCVLAALLGVVLWITGLARAARALWQSIHNNYQFRRCGRQIQLPGEASYVTVLDSEAPLVALTGVARPHVVVSRALLSALTAEQLEAALRHEQAHRAAFDNGKRLLFLLAPDPFAALGRFRALERAWARMAEWAADDRSASGDPRRALTLAETLVRVARMGHVAVNCPVAAQLIHDGSGLRERVERLVEFAGQPTEIRSTPARSALPLTILAGLTLVAGVWQTSILFSAHQLLEVFFR